LEPRLVFRAPTYSLSGDFYLVACSKCGTWQINPHPGQKLCQAYFSRPELWAEGLDPDNNPVSPVKRAEERLKEYIIYARAVNHFLPKGGLVMDIGAGTGLMLSLIPDSFSRLAIEPNQEAAEVARSRGLEVVREWAENLNFSHKPLSGLIFNQALDHLPRPDIILNRTLNRLTPGGLILITGLINPLSLPARLYGQGHRLWNPFHQIYPPLSAVQSVLAAYGLETVGVWRPYFNTPYGNTVKLIADFFKLMGALFIRPKGAVSPPWPGSTYSLLARKKVLFKPLSARSPQAAPIGSAY
jgi:SAM-dependent methyltransferase